jgi:hypothetical protein
MPTRRDLALILALSTAGWCVSWLVLYGGYWAVAAGYNQTVNVLWPAQTPDHPVQLTANRGV